MGKNKDKKNKAGKKGDVVVHPHLEHIAKVAELDARSRDKSLSKKERKAAAASLEALAATGREVTAGKRDPEDIDRSVAGDVANYNENEGRESGRYLTSDDEKLARDKALADSSVDEIKARVQAKRAARAEAEPGEWSKARDKAASEAPVDATPKKRKAGKGEVVVEIDGEHLAVPAMEIVEVATEDGREFAAGAESTPDESAEKAPVKDDFTDPVTGDAFDPEQNVPTNGQGRPLIWDRDLEKLVAMTRATTFIDKLDDKTQIEAWKVRSAIAGVAIALREDNEHESIMAKAADLALVYETEIAKTDKLDRKGKLFDGERAERLLKAKWAYDRAMDALSEEALTVAGTHLKAEHGTRLHMLTAVHDTDGADALRELDPSPADLADVQAYVSAIKAAGIEIIDVERRVVLSDLGVTGTLDRSVFYKPLLRDENGEPFADLRRSSRRVRVVGDLKTGRIDYGAGKIAMQLAVYATGEGYDAQTHEFTKLGLSKTLALLIHLPAGSATCTIYEVDLIKGMEGIKHAITVSNWRKSTTEAQSYRGKSPFYRELLTVSPSAQPTVEIAD